MINKKLFNFIAITFILFLSASLMFAEIKNQPNKKNNTNKADEIQKRIYSYGEFGADLQRNTVSNFQFYTTNYGIFGHNVSQSVGGGHWPRGSQNQYFYGGGIWFGARKMRPDKSGYKNYVEVTYNPNNGRSWMVPGHYLDGDKAIEESASYQKYRTYFSTDFIKSDGSPIISTEGPNWPIWDISLEDTLMTNRYFGRYVYDHATRNRSFLPKGPAFISGEDIFCVFKDSDLSRFDGGETRRKDEGYPLYLQFENTIYSWGFGDYRDFIFIRYDMINTSKDTLLDCWMAPVMDIDIALTSNSSAGAQNDKVRYYDEEDTLNLAVAWSEHPQTSEKGKGFGYFGMDFLESPSALRCEEIIDSLINGNTVEFCAMCIEHEMRWVKEVVGNDTIDVYKEVCTDKLVFDPALDGYLRKDARFFENRYQLGLKTFHRWPIDEDKTEDDDRYFYMSDGVRDGASESPGDIRVLMATGPFTMLPEDTVRVIVGLILARPAVNPETDGKTADLAELVRKDKFAQFVYDNNFRAPIPPEKSIANWRPLNNAIMVTWDTTSDVSWDGLERGLDFMGYRLYRARRSNLDTFDIDQISSSSFVDYPSGKGPFGWKQIANWEIQTPFHKSAIRSGKDRESPAFPLIDSLLIAGPVYDFSTNPPTLDSFAIKLMKVGKGVLFSQPSSWFKTGMELYHQRRPAKPDTLISFLDTLGYLPVIIRIDTGAFADPWGKHYRTLVDENDLPMFHNPFINQEREYPVFYNHNTNTGEMFTSKPHHELFDTVLLGTIHLDQALLSYNPLLYTKQILVIDDKINIDSIPERIRDTVNHRDTINLRHTDRKIIIDGQTLRVIDMMVSINPMLAMRDSNHVKAVLDSVYYYIKHKMFEKLIFNDFENTDLVRTEIIPTYMKKLTNNNTYIDLGDDNANYKIEYNEDPVKTEKIINNVDYYYKVLAYDEGDYMQPTEAKLNDGSVGTTNVVTSYAKAAPIGNKSEFEITYIDQDKMGGLYNFKMFAIDQDRVNQLFGDGREIELEFNPYWNLVTHELADKRTKSFGMYHQRMKLRDTKTDEILFDGITYLEATPCSFLYRGGFTEDAYSWVLSDQLLIDTMQVPPDTVRFGLRDNDERVFRSGKFNSGTFAEKGYCYAQSFKPSALGTLGFSFDFAVQQRGGRYRADTARNGKDKPSNVSTIVGAVLDGDNTDNTDAVMTTQKLDESVYRYEFYNGNYPYYPTSIYGSYNNGPGDYVVTFEEGGYEDMELVYNDGVEKTASFRVPYLNVIVHNNTKIIPPTGPASIEYPGLMEHMVLPDSFPGNPELFPQKVKYYPDPRFLNTDNNTFIGKFNLYSFAWINSRYKPTSIIQLQKQQAWQTNKPEHVKLQLPSSVGTQGRYYLSAANGTDTVDFCNMVQIGGINFAFDYANRGRCFPGSSDLKWAAEDYKKYKYGDDFKAGDQVTLYSTGGAAGFPLPGAKVRFKVTNAQPSSYTDKMMDQIKVVPNPYMISHQGQKSPYDAKIYFTKLPKRCTISIYTVMGDLVTTLEHDEASAYQDQESVEIWNLLSKNKQRVQSQTLVAIITTPDGAKTIKNFSVIVGGFRLIEDL
ncbi:MAG: hypothetical protein KA807_14195 [Prolixibacteraceae bacterium]|nr:hypothetical protein [Prolixibacteraceae bacterium]